METDIDDLYTRIENIEEKLHAIHNVIEKIRTKNASAELVLDEIYDILHMGGLSPNSTK